MVLRECPFCHRPFEAEVLSKEEVDSNEVTSVGEFPATTDFATGGTSQGGLLFARGLPVWGLSESERDAVAMRPEAFITYKVNYKCKHCGKQWTKLQAERIPLPRQYVEDEGEKTDYELHKEDEEAREDQYSE